MSQVQYASTWLSCASYTANTAADTATPVCAASCPNLRLFGRHQFEPQWHLGQPCTSASAWAASPIRTRYSPLLPIPTRQNQPGTVGQLSVFGCTCICEPQHSVLCRSECGNPAVSLPDAAEPSLAAATAAAAAAKCSEEAGKERGRKLRTGPYKSDGARRKCNIRNCTQHTSSVQ